MNKLDCILCRNPYNQPSMCPHCSEVFCLKCIRSYLDDNFFCPCCDNHIIQLISCSRLIDEVKEKIKQNNVKKRQAQQSQMSMCELHNIPIKYQCVTCQKKICSDCGLIDQKHKDHEIKPIQRVIPFLVEKKHLKDIKQKILDKILYSKEEEKKYLLEHQLLKSQIKYNKTKIYEYYEQLILRLERQSQTILTKIDDNLRECLKSIDQKSAAKSQIQMSLQKDCIIGEKIQIDKQLYQYLQNNNYLPKKDSALSHLDESEAQSSAFSFYDRKIHQLSIMKQIYPEYQNFTFQLDYDLNKNVEIIYSPTYEVFGYEWRLKVYPKGNAQTFGQFASVFLQLINSPQALTSNPSKQYLFRLELLNLNMAGKSIIKEYNSKFCVGQCWGYAQFIPLQQLQDYIHEGKLLFVMGIRNISYYDMCQNMKKYVLKIQGQNKVLSELCESYYMNRSGVDSSNNQSQRQEDSSISSLQDLQMF